MSIAPIIVATGHEGLQVLRDVGFDILPYARAAVANAERVDRARRISLTIFAREELVARQERSRELRKVCRQQLVRVVNRVARKELVALVAVVIDFELPEILIQLLVKAEAVLRQPAAQISAVRARELVQVRLNQGDSR